eukprot:TRINITY_DN16477_c0_g1::TRINITY_DN16477_c0_g1_i1::g.1826::m.1826 TRINITY_DN16477_c0_g1::TRINITY_DN16477_c0_g1_i1::g.1826  ORF type:complete len:357 (-),score=14.72,sp/B3QWF5/F16PA_CHLT3/34.83/5e-36,FBPase/PF00316.15/1.7e-29,Prok-E2_B/PF14461.1/3.1,Prok-E2_B/PF14461.1/15 TRINITY_DN16477_c0_g1_i1:9-1013(-)
MEDTGQTFNVHARASFLQNPTDLKGELLRLIDDIGNAVKEVEGRLSQLENREPNRFDPSMATKLLYRHFYHDGYLCLMLSKTEKEALALPADVPYGDYVLCFNALDWDNDVPEGSVCGTIFSVYKRLSPTAQAGTLSDLVGRKASEEVRAGYVLYSSETTLVYTMGQGVFSFSLHPVVKQFFLNPVSPRVRAALTESSQPRCFFDRSELFKNGSESLKAALRMLPSILETQATTVATEHTGVLLSDFHTVLLQGGILITTCEHLCEAAPLAFLMEQAGGRAVNGDAETSSQITKIASQELHEKTLFIVGSGDVVAKFEQLLRSGSRKLKQEKPQ